ncbi:hypothetical protein Btru_025177 [Bulinus truncatus]|nr:hypothetical protein Btru_025177 [Bulinus truncatus]
MFCLDGCQRGDQRLNRDYLEMVPTKYTCCPALTDAGLRRYSRSHCPDSGPHCSDSQVLLMSRLMSHCPESGLIVQTHVSLSRLPGPSLSRLMSHCPNQVLLCPDHVSLSRLRPSLSRPCLIVQTQVSLSRLMSHATPRPHCPDSCLIVQTQSHCPDQCLIVQTRHCIVHSVSLSRLRSHCPDSCLSCPDSGLIVQTHVSLSRLTCFIVLLMSHCPDHISLSQTHVSLSRLCLIVQTTSDQLNDIDIEKR